MHTAKATDGFNGVFFVHFVLGDKDHTHQCDLSNIVMPLIVFLNYGRNSKTDFLRMLPKRMWGKYFGEFINDS